MHPKINITKTTDKIKLSVPFPRIIGYLLLLGIVVNETIGYSIFRDSATAPNYPIVLLSLLVLYYGLIFTLNTTTISLDSSELKVRTGPIPTTRIASYPRIKNISIPTEKMLNIEVHTLIEPNKKGKIDMQHTLSVKTTNGRSTPVYIDTDLDLLEKMAAILREKLGL
jgi:hypothetical protein